MHLWFGALYPFCAQLNLASNQLCGVSTGGFGTYTAEGIKAIAQALSVNAELTCPDGHVQRVVLNSMLLEELQDAVTAEKMSFASFKAQKALLQSTCQHCNTVIKDHAFEQVTAELTSLDVSHNHLRDDGTVTLCNALSENKASKLQELNLRSNDVHQLFTKKGTKSVAAYLAVTASLTSLE